MLAGSAVGGTLKLSKTEGLPTKEKYKISPGGYASKLELIPYEETLKVTFNYDLPALLYNSEMPETCMVDDLTCQWGTQLRSVMNMLRANLTTSGAQSNVTLMALGTRRKRAWFSLAMSAIPIIVDNFPKLLGLFKKTGPPPQQAAVVKYQGGGVPRADSSEMPRALEKLKSHYTKFITSWRENRPKQERFEKHIREEELQVEGLRVITDGILQLVSLDKIMAVCEQGLLPAQLVEWEHLQSAMKKATSHLKNFGAQPVVNQEQWRLLYRMKTTTCSAAGKKFGVQFLLPIQRIGEEQRVFMLTPLPFKFQDLSCYFLEKPMTIVMLGIRTFFLPSSYCDNAEIFCHVPRDTNFDSVPACLTSLFPDAEVLTQSCHPVCQRAIEPIVTGNGDGQLSILTHNDFLLNIVCQDGETQIPNLGVGAMSLKLPCNCEIRSEQKTLVEKRLLCDNGTTPIETEITVPVQWTDRNDLPFRSLMENAPYITNVNFKNVLDEKPQEIIEEFRLPKWAEEFLLTVGAVIIMTIGKVIWMLWKKCRRNGKCKETVIYADTERGVRRRASQNLELD